MLDQKQILAVITARGGSKGLPKKNILPLLGKPLIGWTIEAAQKSKYIDDLYVSTDSPEIANVARSFGVTIDRLRPPELATDTASSIDVVLDSIAAAEREYSKKYDLICLLEPTSPLRDENDIDTALCCLNAFPTATSIVGVCRSESAHPRFLTKMEGNFLVPYADHSSEYVRRQDLAPVYFFEGSLYISTIAAIRTEKAFYHDRTLGYIVPRWKSLEVDELCDLIMAEALMAALKRGTAL